MEPHVPMLVGIVVVSVAEHDARARRERITAEGRAALHRGLGFVAACDEEWSARVGADRYRVVRVVLTELALG